MKKKALSLISFILVCIMLAGALSACTGVPKEDSDSLTPSATETETDKDTNTEVGSQSTGETSAIETETEEDTTPKLDCDNAELIEYAERIANSVTVSYSDSNKTKLILDNANMSLEYALQGEEDQLITALKNAKGDTYLENSMDVFVRMKSGDTFYSSKTSTPTSVNLYRLGYYYYDVRLENQDFAPAPEIISEKEISLKITNYKHLTKPKVKDNEFMTMIKGGNDPYFVFSGISHSADQYTYLQLTMKVESTKTERIDIYYKSEGESSFSDLKMFPFPIITDGEYHTYNICLSNAPGYTGTITGIRIDFMGEEGTQYTIQSPKLLEAKVENVPKLKLGRFFQVYSDKLHHYAQFCATDTVTDIDAVGVLTEISAETVDKLIIKDANGLHDSLDKVDFDSAEYVGFDIKDTGIFGYIVPTGAYGGRLEVTLSDGVYSIIQTLTPANNTIIPSKTGTNNANDFYISQRIYTDPTHDFTKFLNEAEAERHPLTAENIKVHTDGSTNASFAGYDALRGKYVFNLSGTNFGTAYYKSPNKQYKVSFTVTGDTLDRKMYFSSYTTSGGLECAVLLDGQKMLLPIPVEVCKNFVGDGESNLYNLDEPSYGEAYFPMVLKAGEEKSYTVVNLYQNWGQYPLKQISSIQYFYPYYHLSTGVTESNCIVPFADIGPGLPDHRAMSAPLWKDQPQHTLGGHHYFLQYTDADGIYSATQNVGNSISSHGPTYAEVDMQYLSDDGRIKVTYTHMEMPQTDENRTYYIMEYEVLEDISFADFKKDFSFYSVRQTGTGSTYKKVGYLNESNQSVVVDAMAAGQEASYVLGDQCPYFDFFYVPDYTNANGYVNLSFLIYNHSIVIGGKESDAAFIVTNKNERLYLSLNLDSVTLKKGDKITINAILMPWGSQESVYDGSNGKAPDQNVRDVRENTLLDPLKATPISNCTVMDSVYLPKIRTTNGKSAEFTLSGGENNVVTRIYGFDLLTVPVIEEKVNGEWVTCVLNSNTPDSLANTNDYDGYMVHYDGDGTFSYSFVTTLTGDQTRTFRITASEPFAGWPEKDPAEEENAPLNVYCSPSKLQIRLEGAKGVGGLTMLEEDGVSFLRVFGNAKDTEGHSTVYTADAKTESGQYVVIKYRIPTTNTEAAGCFEIFTSTENTRATDGDQIYCYDLKNDGIWHVIVIDVSKENHPTFKTDSDGKYYASYLRFDFFSGIRSKSSYVDIAYVGMCASFEDILTQNSDMNTVTVVTGGSTRTYFDVKTGEEVAESGDGKQPLSQYIDPESGYSESKVKYAACIDMINGWGIGDEQRLTNVGASSLKAPDVLDYGVSTVNGHQLIFTGWAVADGGIAKYVWSADGGKTWNDAIYTKGGTDVMNGLTDHLSSASSRLDGYTFADLEASAKNCSFQGTVGGGASVNGLYADLSAYAGETVEVTFAAIPASDTDTLCIILHVTNVQVAAAE